MIISQIKRDGDEFYIEIPDEEIESLSLEDGDWIDLRLLSKVDSPTESKEVEEKHDELPNVSGETQS